jgi:hypothetical protein
MEAAVGHWSRNASAMRRARPARFPAIIGSGKETVDG